MSTPIGPSPRSSFAEPPPPKHWTLGRVGKIAGFSLLGATGVASLAAGVLSLGMAPLIAIPWFIVGALVLGYSSYKVIQTAKKTDQVASRVFYNIPYESDVLIKPLPPEVMKKARFDMQDKLLLLEHLKGIGLNEDTLLDQAFLEEGKVGYFFRGFIPKLSNGVRKSSFNLEENVPIDFVDTFSVDLNRSTIFVKDVQVTFLTNSDGDPVIIDPKAFLKELYNTGMNPQELNHVQQVINQNASHIFMLKLRLLYSKVLNKPPIDLYAKIDDVKFFVSDPAIKPIQVKLEASYSLNVFDSLNPQKAPEFFAAGKCEIIVPDISNTDPEALDATLQINETDRLAKPL